MNDTLVSMFLQWTEYTKDEYIFRGIVFQSHYMLAEESVCLQIGQLRTIFRKCDFLRCAISDYDFISIIDKIITFSAPH